MSRMVHKQDVVTTRGAPSRLSEEGSATVMVRVRDLRTRGTPPTIIPLKGGSRHPYTPPQAVSKRKVWFCTWAAEHCGNWAQSNGLRLCQKHRRQHDEEEQTLFAASCLAHISNNDQLRDKVGHAENGNANVQQRQKRDRICQDTALLNKYSDGAALTDEEKKRVPRLRKNAQQRKRRRKDSALLNKYYEDDLPVTDEEEKRVL